MKERNGKTISRRTFVGAAASTAFAFNVVPCRVLSREAPSNKLNLAIIGASGQGGYSLKNTTSENLVAMADVGKARSANAARDIVTKEKFRFFDLRLDWAITEGGNSGIMFRVDEQTTRRLPWMVSPEYQLKDPYGKPRKSAGALYGLAAAPKSTVVLNI